MNGKAGVLLTDRAIYSSSPTGCVPLASSRRSVVLFSLSLVSWEPSQSVSVADPNFSGSRHRAWRLAA